VSDARAGDAEAYLRSLGAGESAHVVATLLDHLRATEALLRSWGNPEPVCIAGLCHAAYGTDGFRQALLDPARRAALADRIGAQAERIAYLYGACDRQRFYPRLGGPDELAMPDRFTGAEAPISQEELAAICEIAVANECELAQSGPAYRRKHAAALLDLFARMEGRASGAALAHARALLSPDAPEEAGARPGQDS
jgi:hypothetical protein